MEVQMPTQHDVKPQLLKKRSVRMVLVVKGLAKNSNNSVCMFSVPCQSFCCFTLFDQA